MGREFLDIFEEWAESYDDTVTGQDEQYKAVFQGYEEILAKVADASEGHVLEFGCGTGNLTKKLLDRGLTVTAVEPSPEMREVGKKKLGDLVEIIDGDFLDFSIDFIPSTIVSTYAFHHLTDKEKHEAFHHYGKLLQKGGKIVFADTSYESEESYNEAIEDALQKGFVDLAKDLKREYYTTLPVLEEGLLNAGFRVEFLRCNDFVWLMVATKE
ncbi:SAM-dependent methyltransferase [Bacillus coahuilensis p1.1.43]|uniref:Uncharacterized methyltransferase Q75_10445 n=1 Tax=Bacillus coahuilensis p1.1.43 TaxID=1150625 RepID=A0A147K6U2_9BACI|nr:class I SAM-dependent methyltransferase [Bacillus coahuilensis]KUP05803.1 SAM-dependent methyltransferase [Bacillus coahuilensis p1.1.43]